MNVTASATLAPAAASPYVDALQTCAALLTLVLLGWLSRHFRLVQNADSGLLSRYLYYVALPSLMFKGLSGQEFAALDWNFVLVFLCLRAAFALSFAALAAARRLSLGHYVSLYMDGTWMNTVIFGIPIVRSLYGPSAVIYPVLASVSSFFFQLPLHIVCFELDRAWHPSLDDEFEMSGIRVASSRAERLLRCTSVGGTLLKSLLLNPILYAVCAGILWSFLAWPLPIYLSLIVDLNGATVTPLASFAVGVAMYRRLQLRVWLSTLLLLLVKFFLMPLLCVALVLAFDLPRSPVREVAVIVASMPLALSCFVFASKYKQRTELAAAVVSVSTLLMLPVVLMWIAIVQAIF